MASTPLLRTVNIWVDLDAREDLTCGCISVDIDGTTGAPAHAQIIESADGETFYEIVLSMPWDRAPDQILSA